MKRTPSRPRTWAIAVTAAALGCSGNDGWGPPEGTAASAPEATAANPVTVVLTASQDTSLRLTSPNVNFGAEATLDIHRALVRFDQAALLGAIGAQDYLVSARLDLTLTDNSLRNFQLPRAASVFRLTKSWTESGATWNCAVDGNPSNRKEDCRGATAWSMGVLPPNPWAAPASASAIIALKQTGVVSFDVTADVRAFVSGAAPNDGWVLLSGLLGGFAEFASREGAAPPALSLDVRRCSPSLCDDGNACTVDRCDATAACVHAAAPDGSACEDGDRCTQGDRCVAGACSAGPFVCGAPNVVINEVESNGGVPGDWVELYNAGTAAADVSGWIFKDNDDTHVYAIPAGTSVAPGAYLVLEEASFGFGLGGAESARLYDATGTTLVDSYIWTAHATTTYGRCPNGTGAFATTAAVTKGAANPCGSGSDGGVDGSPDSGVDGSDGSGGLTFTPWPGHDEVVTVDPAGAYSSNLSGLAYQPAADGTPAVLWAVQNGPSLLHRLEWDGAAWSATAIDGWNAGKTLVYPAGAGGPDAEGITLAEWGSPAIYVATERDNTLNTVSRLSVLRFDTSAAGTTLTATHEWNLTADLPAVASNLGLEGIAWVPDAYLVASGFYDEGLARAYDPALYPDHGAGLFFVGVEASGAIDAYALDHTGGGYHRVATIASGQPAVMDLAFDREVGQLFAYCDNTCGNRTTVLAVSAPQTLPGRFGVRGAFERPSTMPDINNEGIAFAPESECIGGQKSFFWSDDGATGGHSIRRGTLRCGPLP